MKYTGTILVAGLSGSAADVTASKWKGIGYFRTRVIPANPNSPGEFGQAEHRGRFATVVAWWHDLEEQVKDDVARLMFGQAVSGFNGFTKRNLQDVSLGTAKVRKEFQWPRIMPLNASVNPIADDLALDAGEETKELDLSWSQGESDEADKMYFVAGEAADEDAVPANLFLVEKDITLTNGSPSTLTMPSAGQGYRIFALVEHTEDHTFSIARTAFGTSKA